MQKIKYLKKIWYLGFCGPRNRNSLVDWLLQSRMTPFPVLHTLFNSLKFCILPVDIYFCECYIYPYIYAMKNLHFIKVLNPFCNI